MIDKFRENYKLSSLLVRILFVITYVFANWQISTNAIGLTSLMYSELNVSIWMVILVGIIAGAIVMLLLPLVTNLVLNFTKLYNIPRAEYGLVVIAFGIVYNLILGVLRLVNFYTPIFFTWSTYIFPVVAWTITALLFYKTTSKLYFNDVTRVYYFRICSAIYFVFAIIVGVL